MGVRTARPSMALSIFYIYVIHYNMLQYRYLQRPKHGGPPADGGHPDRRRTGGHPGGRRTGGRYTTDGRTHMRACARALWGKGGYGGSPNVERPERSLAFFFFWFYPSKTRGGKDNRHSRCSKTKEEEIAPLPSTLFFSGGLLKRVSK